MTEAARGRDVTLQFIDDEGDLVASGNVDAFEARMSGELGRDERLGETEPDTVERLDGFEGTFTVKHDNEVWDLLIQRKIDNHLGPRRRLRMQILETVYYPETGGTATYLYPDAVFLPSKNAAGRNDFITSQFEWQSKMRRRV